MARYRRNQFSVVKAGDCFGQDPRNDTGYVVDAILFLHYTAISTFTHAMTLAMPR